MFAVDNIKSFEKTDSYTALIRRVIDPDDVPIILVGNKTDLPRQVDHKLAQSFAKQRKMVGYLETSAKTRVGVDNVFFSLAKQIR